MTTTALGARPVRPAITAQIGEFYSAADVARIFNWSKAAVYRGIESGAIPCVRLGRTIRIPESWIERFIADQLEETTTDLTEADHDARTALALATTPQRPSQVPA